MLTTKLRRLFLEGPRPIESEYVYFYSTVCGLFGLGDRFDLRIIPGLRNLQHVYLSIQDIDWDLCLLPSLKTVHIETRNETGYTPRHLHCHFKGPYAIECVRVFEH